MKNLLFSLLLLLVSCNLNSNRTNKTQALTEFSDEVKIDVSDFESIIFIPLEGCGSCIQNAIEFYKVNYQNPNILYVFCTYKPFDYPYLKNYNDLNVFIDTNNVALKNRILTTGPVAFKKIDGLFEFKKLVNIEDYDVLY